jgi:lipopolysaccharide export system permease protein
MIGRIVRPLDRYVFGEFWKIFVATALGFPLLVIVIDLTDHLRGYLDRKIPVRDVALSYLYWIPDSMFMVLPAAVLFATVFAIGAFTRHAEVTAAKASGISFYRMIMPILLGSVLACGLDIVLGELSPATNKRRSELLNEDKSGTGGFDSTFAYSGEFGRVYKISQLRTDSGRISGLQIERKGRGPGYPTYLLSADSGMYRANNRAHPWVLAKGAISVGSGFRIDIHDVVRGGVRQALRRTAVGDDDEVARTRTTCAIRKSRGTSTRSSDRVVTPICRASSAR